MVFPAIRLHQLYSLNLNDGLEIIFEDLSMIDMNALKSAIDNKMFDKLELVPRTLSFNMSDKTLTVFGHRIRKGKYMVNMERNGDIHMITYDVSNENIIRGLEYLYHMILTLKVAT